MEKTFIMVTENIGPKNSWILDGNKLLHVSLFLPLEKEKLKHINVIMS